MPVSGRLGKALREKSLLFPARGRRGKAKEPEAGSRNLRPWWSHVERIGGGLMGFGGIWITAAGAFAATWHSGRQGQGNPYFDWIIAGVFVAVAGFSVLAVGIGGQIAGSRAGGEAAVSSAAQGTLVLTNAGPGYALYAWPDRKTWRFPVLTLKTRLFAAIPHGAPTVTLLRASVAIDVDDSPYSDEDGQVHQFVVHEAFPPADLTYPPEVVADKALEIECVFRITMPWDPLQERVTAPDATSNGHVLVYDQLGRPTEIDVDFGPVLMDPES